jgi:hypothetical protein
VKINLPRWLTHHALKLLPFVAVANILTTDIKGRHWAINVASWVLLAAMAMLLAMGAIHAYLGHPCQLCKAKPAERLRRPHYRAVIAISRHAGLPLAVIVGSILAVVPMIWGDPRYGDRIFEWKQDAVRASLSLAITMFLAAVRFDRANYPDRVRPTPITTFLRKRATGLIHKGHWLYLAAMIPLAATGFLPQTGAWGTLGYLSGMLSIGGQYINSQHGTTLCEECVTEFPTDAPEYAAQRKWRFTVFHRWSGIRALLAVVAIIVVSHFLSRPWSGVAYLPLLLFVGLLVVMARFHSSYQPWCPYCRRGRGGDDPEVAPDPTGDHGRPLPVG